MARFPTINMRTLFVVLSCLNLVHAFIPPTGPATMRGWLQQAPPSLPPHLLQALSLQQTLSSTALNAEKRKRRRRKQAPVESAAPVEKPSAATPIVSEQDTTVEIGKAEKPIATSGEFKFDRNEAISLGITDAEDEDDFIPEFASPKGLDLSKGAVELPTFGDAMKKKKGKKMMSEEEELDDEDVADADKIKRSDISSFKKLLEVEPNADTDASFFEAEEYGTVSALLSEGAKPFLGIPSGPLQVGHFIGALVIVLMAFVEYPGFPLTNLPGPLRDALQGGLGTIFTINAVLAVIATFQAGERGQPRFLWAAKSFSVGGLAYDQLTQLPTLKEIEARKAKKGKRALKRNK